MKLGLTLCALLLSTPLLASGIFVPGGGGGGSAALPLGGFGTVGTPALKNFEAMRSSGYYMPAVNPQDIAHGLPIPTVQGTTNFTVAMGNGKFRNMYVQTTSASGFYGGIWSTSAVTAPLYLPIMTARFYFEQGLTTNNRWWVGLASTAPGNTAVAASASSATVIAAFAYDFGYSSNWQVVTGDGTTMTATDTGLSATTGNYGPGASLIEKIDWSSAGQVKFTIAYVTAANAIGGSATFTKTTNIAAGTSTAALNIYQTLTNLLATPSTLWFGGITIEQN